MSEKSQAAVKATLSTGKVVLLRQMLIKHQTLAATAIGRRASDNTMAMAMMMQQELVKILLVQIDGRTLKASEREDLDALLTYSEFGQLQKVVGQMMGGDEGEAQTEFVVTGTP